MEYFIKIVETALLEDKDKTIPIVGVRRGAKLLEVRRGFPEGSCSPLTKGWI